MALDSPDQALNGFLQTALSNSVVEINSNTIELFTRLVLSGVTISDAGVIAFGSSLTISAAAITSGTLAVARGGTNIGTYAIGDLLYASAAGVLSALADVATGNALLSGGVGTAPSYGKVGLGTHVSGTLAVANGGTGLASGTSGGVLAYTAAGTVASSAALAANELVLGGGAGVVPATVGSLGTTTTVLHGNAAGAPTYAAVSLSADVSGDLPFANLVQASAISVLAGRGAAAGAGDFQEITLGAGLSMTGTALSATGGSGAMTLLAASNGTSTAAGATNVATQAITGLTALDTLIVYAGYASVVQNTANVQLYNSTDSVTIDAYGQVAVVDGPRGGFYTVRQAQAGNTLVDSVEAIDALRTVVRSTFTTAWTGAWTLALRHDGVVAGGTFQWSWAVYKVAGQ